MSSSMVEGVERFIDREQELNDTLYAEAVKGYTATMWCAKCGERTKVLDVCLVFAWEPECDHCRTTVKLSEARVIVNGPTDQLVSHANDIRKRLTA